GDEPVTPLSPRIAVRAAEYDLPAGLVAALEAQLRSQSAADRLDEVLDELVRVRREVGYPPLAAPIGQILGSQALLNVLSAKRYSVPSAAARPASNRSRRASTARAPSASARSCASSRRPASAR